MKKRRSFPQATIYSSPSTRTLPTIGSLEAIRSGFFAYTATSTLFAFARSIPARWHQAANMRTSTPPSPL